MMKRRKKRSDPLIALSKLDTDGPLTRGGQGELRVYRCADAILEAQPNQPRAGEDDCIKFTVI